MNINILINKCLKEMKFIGLVNKNEVETIYTNNKVNNLLGYTSVDKLTIKIGFQFVDNLWVAKYMAIQMDNSETNEMYELFEINYDIQTSSDKEMKEVICQMADEIVRYNKDIMQYYFKR